MTWNMALALTVTISIVLVTVIKKILSSIYYKEFYIAMYVDRDERVLFRLFESRIVSWVLSVKTVYLLKLRWAIETKNTKNALMLWKAFPKYMMWSKTHAISASMMFAFLCESGRTELAEDICDKVVLNQRNIRYLDPILLKEVYFFRAFYIERSTEIDPNYIEILNGKIRTKLRPWSVYQNLNINH